MKEEIRKYKKIILFRHLIYFLMLVFMAIQHTVNLIFGFVEINFFAKLASIILLSLVISLCVLFFVFLGIGNKQRKKIADDYKKESEIKYGVINNRLWVDVLDKKQKKIKRKRTSIFWIITGALLSIFIPFLVILIIKGVDEQNSLAVASLIIVIISGALLLIPVIFLVCCYVSLRLKIYEIEGIIIVGLVFLNGIELYLENRKIGIYTVSGGEDTFTTDNGIELTYNDGLIYKKEDNPKLKKS